ncbi:unnamed protein product [Closterium sp. Naga37s-1]|nr:unnamed protein product [Closterium sp. Naga37s-1]
MTGISGSEQQIPASAGPEAAAECENATRDITTGEAGSAGEVKTAGDEEKPLLGVAGAAEAPPPAAETATAEGGERAAAQGEAETGAVPAPIPSAKRLREEGDDVTATAAVAVGTTGAARGGDGGADEARVPGEKAGGAAAVAVEEVKPGSQEGIGGQGKKKKARRRRVQWDEGNLAYWEEHRTPRQRIDEPKTPFHSLGPDSEEEHLPGSSTAGAATAGRGTAGGSGAARVAAVVGGSSRVSEWTSSEDEGDHSEFERWMEEQGHTYKDPATLAAAVASGTAPASLLDADIYYSTGRDKGKGKEPMGSVAPSFREHRKRHYDEFKKMKLLQAERAEAGEDVGDDGNGLVRQGVEPAAVDPAAAAAAANVIYAPPSLPIPSPRELATTESRSPQIPPARSVKMSSDASNPSQYVKLKKEYITDQPDTEPGELSQPVEVPQLDVQRCFECGQILPQSYEPPQDEPWSTGIFACFKDQRSCIQGLFCPCVLFGKNVEAIRDDIPWSAACACHVMCIEGGVALGTALLCCPAYITVDPQTLFLLGETLFFAWWMCGIYTGLFRQELQKKYHLKLSSLRHLSQLFTSCFLASFTSLSPPAIPSLLLSPRLIPLHRPSFPPVYSDPPHPLKSPPFHHLAAPAHLLSALPQSSPPPHSHLPRSSPLSPFPPFLTNQNAPCDPCCVHCILHPCALCQEHREMVIRLPALDEGVSLNPPPQQEMAAVGGDAAAAAPNGSGEIARES